MITLAKKIKEEREKKEKGNNASEVPKSTRISVRDKLLTKGKIISSVFATVPRFVRRKKNDDTS